jgi:hypothetical protein
MHTHINKQVFKEKHGLLYFNVHNKETQLEF